MSVNEAEQLLERLKTIIKEIILKPPETLDNDLLDEFSWYARINVTNGYGENLYNGTKDFITDHLRYKICGEVLASLKNNFLQTFIGAWKDHKKVTRNTGRFLFVMNDVDHYQRNVVNFKYFVPKSFCNEVILQKEIREQLQNVLLDMVMRDRKGESMDRNLIRKSCKILMKVSKERDVYEQVFEEAFIEQSEDFYRLENEKFLAEIMHLYT